jgi:hypothetical protein
VIPKAKGIVIS